MEEPEFWLFGYGSLIWKPPPHFDRRIPGYIEGFVRRFWQASEDHRGTPEAPGRVVTLIERAFWEQLTDHHATAADDRVWGVAYRIAAPHVREVQEYLDIREINGYSIEYTPFYPAAALSGSRDERSSAQQPIRCMVYIGLPSNPQFVGVQEPQALAEWIHRSRGPSGENREYLFMLEHALDGLSPASGDEHVHDLAERVRAIERREDQAGAVPDGVVDETGEAVRNELRKVGSTDEQEEVEKS